MLLGFQKQFVADVLSGKKKQTMRDLRKRPFRPGDDLQMYHGLRTKQCQKLGDSVCTVTKEIVVRSMESTVNKGSWPMWKSSIYTNHNYLNDNNLNLKLCLYDAFARADGFRDFNNMCDWIFKTHPKCRHDEGKGFTWEPQLIKWNDLTITKGLVIPGVWPQAKD